MSNKTKKKPDLFAVGKTGKFKVPLRSEGEVCFRVDVNIIGVREKFGRVDYRITPVRGDGEAFVSSKSVEDIKP